MRRTFRLSLLATVVAVWSLGHLQTELRSAEEPVALKRVRLFAAEGWYKKQAGKEQVFEGVLQKVDLNGVFGFGRMNPYRLQMKNDMRDVYMGSKRKQLDPYVGLQVRLRGKAVDLRLEGSVFREIWPAELVVVGKPAKGPVARGPRVLRQTGFVVKDDAKATSVVIRSAAELKKAMNEQILTATKKLKLDDLDFMKHMIILVKSGRTNAFGVRITVNKIAVAGDGKSATVHWMHRPYYGGAAPPNQPGNPGAIAVVERFNGPLKFKKTIWRPPVGLPLPPSAPPAGGGGPLRPKRPPAVRPGPRPVGAPPAIRPGQAPARPEPKDPNSARINKAIKDRIAGRIDADDLRLDVFWRGRSATVHGNGVGIWNRQKQFSLQQSQIVELLKILDEAKFAEMKSSFGGFARPAGGPAIGAPVALMGSVNLSIGVLSKGSNQLGGGGQSKELDALATKILDACEEAAKEGITAVDLSDGLSKIASGKLHPMMMSLLVQRIENEGRGPNGWILRVKGRQAQVQVRSKTGIAKPTKKELTDMQLAALCRLLTDNDVSGLPINLWASDYTDFRVSIFRAKKSLQARKFARLTPKTHGEKQKNFDRIFAGLDKLQQDVVKTGTK